MATRPTVIAFDVIETLFPLEPLRRRLVDAGQPEQLLELWFARLLRDAFALVATGGYRPFGEVAASALKATATAPVDDETIKTILAGFAELDAHPDVAPAIQRAAQAGIRMVTLTNGSARNTTALLRRARVERHIEQVLSVDDIRRWKPAPQIYHHAAASTGVSSDHIALVAAHAWDTHGAHHAGMTTGWVTRLEGQYPAVFSPPDVIGHDLLEVIDALLALPSE